MFAVVKIAGQQYKVEKDQTLYVPHLGGNPGDKVEFAEITLVDKDGKLSLGKDIKAKIKAEIVDHDDIAKLLTGIDSNIQPHPTIGNIIAGCS